MLQTILISVLILVIAILLLGVRVFFTKNGKFPSIHIGGNKAMKEKGISCATSQDREAQKTKKRFDNEKVLKEIIDNY